MTTALRFLPPLAWSVLIAWFSSARWRGGATAPLLEPWLRALLPWATPEQIAAPTGSLRKTGHVVEYAVLALLWRRALAGPRDRTWRVAARARGAHRRDSTRCTRPLTPTREGRVADVLLDGGAAAGALAGGHARCAPRRRRLAWLLLWAAAARRHRACSRSIWRPPRRRAGSG